MRGVHCSPQDSSRDFSRLRRKSSSSSSSRGCNRDQLGFQAPMTMGRQAPGRVVSACLFDSPLPPCRDLQVSQPSPPYLPTGAPHARPPARSSRTKPQEAHSFDRVPLLSTVQGFDGGARALGKENRFALWSLRGRVPRILLEVD